MRKGNFMENLRLGHSIPVSLIGESGGLSQHMSVGSRLLAPAPMVARRRKSQEEHGGRI
jgi:hypothetical protein